MSREYLKSEHSEDLGEVRSTEPDTRLLFYLHGGKQRRPGNLGDGKCASAGWGVVEYGQAPIECAGLTSIGGNESRPDSLGMGACQPKITRFYVNESGYSTYLA